MFCFRKIVLFSFLSLFFTGTLGCGEGGGGGTSSPASVEDVDDNVKKDSVLTGEGIIDPLMLSGGDKGTARSHETYFNFGVSLSSPNCPVILESFIIVGDDVLNSIPVTLCSSDETYSPTTAAQKVFDHIEEQAIYSGFRSRLSDSTVHIEAPVNVPSKYKYKKGTWKFLIGPSGTVRNEATTFRNGVGGHAVHYSETVIALHADLPANAPDHEITIDGVTIDLGTKALTREEIAKKIADTDFSSGDNYKNVGVYYVGASGYSLIFRRKEGNANLDDEITIQDNTYTGVPLSD